jgi:hypothetical protein
VANANFQITFRGGELAGNLVRFDPGTRMEALVQVMPLENIRSKRVLARVGWHTEGRGDTDAQTVGELELAQGGLTANTPLSQAFAYDLPRQPWSFAGHYVTIVWDVRVIVDIPLGSDLQAVQPFILAPRRI